MLRFFNLQAIRRVNCPQTQFDVRQRTLRLARPVGGTESRLCSRASPDFLCSLVAPPRFLRLSLTKAAYAVASCAAYRKSGFSAGMLKPHWSRVRKPQRRSHPLSTGLNLERI